MNRTLFFSSKLGSFSVVKGVSSTSTSISTSTSVSIDTISKSYGYMLGLIIHSNMKSPENILLLERRFKNPSMNFGNNSSNFSSSVKVETLFDSSRLSINTELLPHISFLFSYSNVSYDNSYREARKDIYMEMVDLLAKRGVVVDITVFSSDSFVRDMERSALISFVSLTCTSPKLVLFIEGEFKRQKEIHPHEIGDLFALFYNCRFPLVLPEELHTDNVYSSSDLKHLVVSDKGKIIMNSMDVKNLTANSISGVSRSVSNWINKPYNLLSVNVSNVSPNVSDMSSLAKSIYSLSNYQIRSDVHVWSTVFFPFSNHVVKESLHRMLLESSHSSSSLSDSAIYARSKMFYESGILKPLNINYSVFVRQPDTDQSLSELSSLKKNPDLVIKSNLAFNKVDESDIFSLADITKNL
ncbi:MAG: hypothetical protein ACXVHW_09720 [Methanobacterium sp.]